MIRPDAESLRLRLRFLDDILDVRNILEKLPDAYGGTRRAARLIGFWADIGRLNAAAAGAAAANRVNVLDRSRKA